MEITKEPFGTTPDGEEVFLYTLGDPNAAHVKITNYGGIVTEIHMPGKDGAYEDVVLGYDNLQDYIDNSPYFGCITGRYANRIAGGKFELDGQEFALAVNNGPNHLHGGERGFDKHVWKAQEIENADSVSLKLTRTSPHMEEGYPGNLDTTVTYTFTKDNELRIDYLATTDKPTVVSLTNHSYFNLAGEGDGQILDHIMMVKAASYTPVDENLIPTGVAPVAGTPLDFTEPTPIGERIDADHEQLNFGKGYDHNYVIDGEMGSLRLAARVVEPESGRVLEVHTTEPGIQLYTGNFLDGSNVGKSGKPYPHRGAFCLETQRYPDSPNQPDFPSSVLRPGEKYETTTVFKFSTES